jgi:predicted permease
LVITKIIGIFLIVFIGYGANKIGWVPASASRPLSKIVINIAAPCALLTGVIEYEYTDDAVFTILMLFGMAALLYVYQWGVGLLACKLMKVPREDKGVYMNFILLTNCGYLGFPVSLAAFGSTGLFYMVIMNCVMNIVAFTLGIANVRKADAEKLSFGKSVKRLLKDVINMPVVALAIGLVLFFLRVPVPEDITYILDMIGSMMAPLSMIVIGLQLTESRPSEVIKNRNLLWVSLLRLIVIPGVFFLAVLPIGFDPQVLSVMMLFLALPCAAIPVVFAEEYGANAKLAAEGTFLSTLFSMISIPILSYLLTTML